PKPVHDTPHMIGVITHAEAGLYGVRETGCGPPIAIETTVAGARVVDFGDNTKLLGIETARTAGSATFAQPFHSSAVQGAAPSGRSRSCNPELSGYLRLRKSPLQVLCG